jgi:uncharacterized protein
VKYLLVLLLLAVVVWRWRQASAVRTAQSTRPKTPNTATTMVACKHCAVHVPASDAVPGRNGSFYCSPQHRQLQEP